MWPEIAACSRQKTASYRFIAIECSKITFVLLLGQRLVTIDFKQIELVCSANLLWRGSFPLERPTAGAHTCSVLLAVVLLGMLSLPLIVRLAGVLVRREWEQIVEQRRPAASSAVAIERVAADLRRLRSRLETCENQPGTTGKGMKMGALRVAYVEVLQLACTQLEIEPPRTMGRLQTPMAEIYRVEAALRERGLDVRPPEFPQHFAA